MARTLLGDVTAGLRNLTNRAPVAYAPHSGRASVGSGFLRPAGQEAQMRAMGSSSTLYAIVDRITTTYAGVEWGLYRSAKSGRDEDRQEVVSHPALDLWNRPNPFMTGPQFRETAQQHEELVGEQWWVSAHAKTSTIPQELWPVRPDRMEPEPDPEEFLTGYVYRGPSGERVPLGRDEVIFQRRPNPLDPYRGMGVVQTILMDIDATRASAEWNRIFFENNAAPGGIIQAERRLDDDEFNEFQARWRETHKGLANAHRVGILEEGMTWVDRKYTMQDMQFAELRSVNREIIREAFGFPKPMLGATDDVNRANAEAAAYVFARWLIQPRLERTREVLNTQLLPMFGVLGRGLEFDFANPVPADIETEAKQLTARTTAVALLVREGFDPSGSLSAVGLPDIPHIGAAPGKALPLPVDAAWDDAVAGLLGEDIENAQRWVAVAVDDGDTCHNCRENDGHTYKNRAEAYADYPEGEGYVRCEGVAYGNACRCKVVKRGRKGQSE